MHGTGGGPEKILISVIEYRLMNIIGWNSVDGDGITAEYAGVVSVSILPISTVFYKLM